MPQKPSIQIGKQYGTRTVVKMLPKNAGSNAIRCLVRCECGKESEVFGYTLIRGIGCGSCSRKKQHIAPISKQCGGLGSYLKGCKCSSCREANAKSISKYRKTEKGKIVVRNSNLKKYGITSSEYDELYKRQNGLCAICKKPETKTNQYGLIRLAVDHCHKSGLNRGLLCMKCNRALGLLMENLNTIQSMYEYINKYKNENK